MRIIAGKHKGRRLVSPVGNKVRPTSDKVRGAIFNILQNYVSWDQIIALDVCCGTGAFGLEALSRGAKFCGFIDSSKESTIVTKKNIELLREENNSIIYQYKIEELPTSIKRYNLCYIDPPYFGGLADMAVNSLVKSCWLEPKAFVIIEVSKQEELQNKCNLNILQTRLYGSTKIVILQS